MLYSVTQSLIKIKNAANTKYKTTYIEYTQSNNQLLEFFRRHNLIESFFVSLQNNKNILTINFCVLTNGFNVIKNINIFVTKKKKILKCSMLDLQLLHQKKSFLNEFIIITDNKFFCNTAECLHKKKEGIILGKIYVQSN